MDNWFFKTDLRSFIFLNFRKFNISGGPPLYARITIIICTLHATTLQKNLKHADWKDEVKNVFPLDIFLFNFQLYQLLIKKNILQIN